MQYRCKVCRIQTMGRAMWWRVTIYIIILGNVSGDGKVDEPQETNSTSDVTSPTRTTIIASSHEIVSSSAETSSPTSNIDGLLTLTLTTGEVISATNASILQTSADVQSSESFVLSTESLTSVVYTSETSLTSTSTEVPVLSHSSLKSSPVLSTTTEPSLSSDSSIQIESTASHQLESSMATTVSSLAASTTERSNSFGSSTAPSSSLLQTGTYSANTQSTTPEILTSSLELQPTASEMQSTSYSSTQPTSGSPQYTNETSPPTSSSPPLPSIPPSPSSPLPNGTSPDTVIPTSTTLVTTDDLHSSSVSITVDLSSSDTSVAENQTSVTSPLPPETTTSLVMSSSDGPVSSVILQTTSLLLITSSFSTSSVLQSSFQTSSSLEKSPSSTSANIPTSRSLDSSTVLSLSTVHGSQHSFSSSIIAISPTVFDTSPSIATTQTMDSVAVNTSSYITQYVSQPSSSSASVFETLSSSFSQHSVLPSSSSVTTVFSSAATSSSNVYLTSAIDQPVATTTPPHSKDQEFVNHTFEIVFQGNCEPLVKDKLLLKAFWRELKQNLVNELNQTQMIEAGNIACDPLRITFTFNFIPKNSFKALCSSLDALVSDIHVNVTINGRVEYYRAEKLNTAATIKEGGIQPSEAKGFSKIDLIVLITAGSFCLVLILVGMVICIREYYHRRRTRTFEFANKYQVEDFTLTKIPRPAVTYTEKGIDINTNGHSHHSNPREKDTLMDSIQLRVNSNENGLMVGVTGTLERQAGAPDPSPPSPSPPGSEHQQLVPREEEPLQSQDNPIYYIDDDISE